MRHAVILAGGSGVRLWPASRRATPKQLLPLGGAGETLLAATWRRLTDVCAPDNIAVVTAASQASQVRAALPDLPPPGVIAEPVGRNTAAAIGLAAVYLHHRDPDAVMAALPSDHHIADEPRFIETAERAFAIAEASEMIVTVGIVPTRPETGFGYLQLGDAHGEHAYVVQRFVEKPDAATAEAYLASGEFLWNGGMFFVKVSRLLREFAALMPETHAARAEIQAALRSSEDADAVAARVYPDLPSVSIDYGVMERTSDVVTVRGEFGWNDVGSWSSLAEYRPADERGNVTEGVVITHDATDNIIIADPGSTVAVIGVTDLVVIRSGNATLIVPRDRAQDVRAVVSALDEQHLDDFL